MNKKLVSIFCLFSFMLFSFGAQAKVPAAEAEKLGTSLTPFGSIKEANKYKTIPAWKGGVTEVPDGYRGNGFTHIDTFASDKIKF